MQKNKSINTGLLATLLGFFGAGRTRRSFRVPTGNRSLPPHMQQEVQVKAQAKRERKMQRLGGWYNG